MYAIHTAPVFKVAILGDGTITPGGTGGVSEPWARIAGDATIYAQRKIASAVKEAVGVTKVTREEAATISGGGKPEFGCVVTISGVSGDGSAGSSPFQEYSDFAVQATDTTANINWKVSPLTNEFITFGANTDDLYIHPIATFPSTPIQVDADAQPVYNAREQSGCVSREGKYSYISGASADTSALRAMDNTTRIMYNFGGVINRYALAAEDDGDGSGNPAVYVYEDGPVVRRYNPNFGTEALGSVVWTANIDVLGLGSLAAFDNDGFIWFSRGAAFYQVRKSDGVVFNHRYPEEIGTTGGIGGSSDVVFDPIRRKLYVVLKNTTGGTESNYAYIYEYKNWSPNGLDYSGNWTRIMSFPTGAASGLCMSYDPGEDVLFVANRGDGTVHRLAGNPKTQIDVVRVRDDTPDNPFIDYNIDSVVSTYYKDKCGWLTVEKGGVIFVLRMCYKGANLDTSGLGALFSAPIGWSYEILSATEARIYTYLNVEPYPLVNCEFSVSLPDLISTGEGGTAVQTQHRLVVPFMYGDATPKSLGTISANKQIFSTQIFITTAFDGSSPSLSIGTSGSPADLMATSDNDPNTIGEYSVYTKKVYGANTELFLTINAGAGAGAGAGIVLIDYQA